MLRIFSVAVTAAYLAVWLRYLKSFFGEDSRRAGAPAAWAMAAAAFHSVIAFGLLPWHDAKVMTTVFTWLVYLAVLVFKPLFGWQGRRMSILSVCGFVIVAASMIFVNVIPHTFHNMY